MRREGIPVKEIFPPYENPADTERKFAAMKSLLKKRFDFISPEHRPTVLDFQGLNPSSKEEDFLKWIEREMEIKPEIIEENGNSPESAQKYRLLNYAFQEAKNFLRDTLKYPQEELFKDIEVKSILSKKDIFDLLKKTRLIAGNSEPLRRQSIEYCRLVKTTLAVYETLKNDSKLLSKNTTDFEEALVSFPLEEGNTPLVFSGEHNSLGRGFQATDNNKLQGIINSRAKEFEGVILRLLTRPDSNAKVALEDGIATRITITKDQAVQLLPILYEWLVKNMKVTDINIQNKYFFSKQQIKRMPHTFKILDEDKLNLSGMRFEAVVIKGKLHSSSHGGQFEIQLVDPDNKNEEGEMEHNIYDVVKFVIARTRLDGGCPENVFEKFIDDAHTKSGMSIKEIKYNLLERPGAPIVKKRKNNNKYVYIAYSVYQRWNEFNWVDKSLFSEIQKAHK